MLTKSCSLIMLSNHGGTGNPGIHRGRQPGWAVLRSLSGATRNSFANRGAPPGDGGLPTRGAIVPAHHGTVSLRGTGADCAPEIRRTVCAGRRGNGGGEPGRQGTGVVCSEPERGGSRCESHCARVPDTEFAGTAAKGACSGVGRRTALRH